MNFLITCFHVIEMSNMLAKAARRVKDYIASSAYIS